MKIVRIVPEKLPVPPILGGAIETGVYEVCKRLENEFDLSIVSRPSSIKKKDKLNYIYINRNFFEKICDFLITKFDKKNPLRVIAKIHNVLIYSLKTAIKIKNKFQIIHIHNDPNFVPLIKKFNKESKIILHLHNDHLITSKLLYNHYYKIINNCELIICVSHYIKDQIDKKFKNAKRKTIVLHNGTNTNNFKPISNEKSKLIKANYGKKTDLFILYVGRLTKEKGVHILIESFKNVLPKHPNAKLLVVGSSWFKNSKKTEYTNHLEKISKDIKEKILFTGFIQNQKLYDIYAISDIFVCPSIWNEPFGLVCPEAMASEKAVIATKVGGIPEIIDNNIDGILIKPNNQQELTNKLIDLLNDSNKRSQIGRNARKKVIAKFDWNIVAKRTKKIYAKIK